MELLRLWNEVHISTLLCLCYHGIPRSQPITLLRHFEFFILIIFCVPSATWKLVQVAGYSAVKPFRREWYLFKQKRYIAKQKRYIMKRKWYITTLEWCIAKWKRYIAGRKRHLSKRHGHDISPRNKSIALKISFKYCNISLNIADVLRYSSIIVCITFAQYCIWSNYLWWL